MWLEGCLGWGFGVWEGGVCKSKLVGRLASCFWDLGMDFGVFLALLFVFYTRFSHL